MILIVKIFQVQCKFIACCVKVLSFNVVSGFEDYYDVVCLKNYCTCQSFTVLNKMQTGITLYQF